MKQTSAVTAVSRSLCISASQSRENLSRPRLSLRFFYTLALLLAFIYIPSLRAQTAGSISGHLVDPSGANLPDTDVTLTQVATGAVRSTKSTGTGDYTFAEVPPGAYSLQIRHEGFKVVKSDTFDVQIDQSVRLNFTLQIGAVTESVDVTATGALLQSEDASTGTVVENTVINQLPLNGRNYLSLVALSSNVNTLSPASGQAGSRLGGDRASQSIAVGGQRIMFDYYTLDGVNNTDPDFNTYVGLPSLDGIQEFKVQTGVYSAEFGHEASQINVVSKTGTNTYHGALYEYIRNNYVDAKPYFFPYHDDPARGVSLSNGTTSDSSWTARSGFPRSYDGRDKFFFMVDDEWRHIRQIGQGQAVVPTAAMAAGNFQGIATRTPQASIQSRSTNRSRTSHSRTTPFHPNRISAVSTRLLKYWEQRRMHRPILAVPPVARSTITIPIQRHHRRTGRA